MMRRVLSSCGVAAMVVVVATLPVSSQGPGQGSVAATTPPLVITAFNGEPAPANWTVAQDAVGRARPPGRLEQRRRHIRRVARWRPWRRRGADRSVPQRRTVGGAAEADSAGNHDRRERGRLVPRRLRPARLPPDLVHRRSARRHPAAAAAGGARHARASATAARSATARSTPSTTSPTTTAASRAASGDRSCASSTATATASCRRRAWWPSATR